MAIKCQAQKKHMSHLLMLFVQSLASVNQKGTQMCNLTMWPGVEGIYNYLMNRTSDDHSGLFLCMCGMD